MRTRRLSPLRVLLVVAAVLLAGAGAAAAVGGVRDLLVEPNPIEVSPYVDVTLTPTFHFEDPDVNPADEVVLGFVVSDPRDPCEPSWGTYYDLDGAARALDLDRRIERHAARGGSVTVSFGGFANTHLEVGCTDADDLADAYLAVVERYDLATIDLDVEGPALEDREASVRRAEAIAMVQDETGVEVWLTLPVSTAGMTGSGMAVVEELLDAGVELGGVNAMTMNYGEDRQAPLTMGEAAVQSLRGVHRQLATVYGDRGVTVDEATLWQQVGATPMIGVNDVPGDTFTLDDAERLADFARATAMGRLSHWSLNRDAPCGPSGSSGLSNTCSGVEQELMAFTWAFLSGPVVSAEPAPATASAEVAAMLRDDPTRSPYPIWSPDQQFEGGDRVVWDGDVYVAKWWSEDAAPDAPVDQPWDSPWRWLGPVLESDLRVVDEARTVLDGEWDAWDPEVEYLVGEEVLHDERVWRARWWSQGTVPDPDGGTAHAWELVGEAATPVGDGVDTWRDESVYVAGAEVQHRGRLFRAAWWNRGEEPLVDPESPFSHPWELVGDVEDDG